MRLHVAVLALAMFSATAAVAADDAKPSLKLVDPVVQVLPGARD